MTAFIIMYFTTLALIFGWRLAESVHKVEPVSRLRWNSKYALLFTFLTMAGTAYLAFADIVSQDLQGAAIVQIGLPKLWAMLLIGFLLGGVGWLTATLGGRYLPKILRTIF